MTRLTREIFQPIDLQVELEESIASIKDSSIRNFTKDALGRLWGVGNKLVEKGIIKEISSFQRGLIEWVRDEQHGAQHSYWVFKKEKEIRDAEEFKISDEDLLARAILHDMAEFLPWYNLKTGEEIKLDKKRADRRAKLHPQIMTRMVSLVGKILNVEDANQLATDIFYHDYYWKKPKKTEAMWVARRLSDAGKCLADADRLAVSVEDADAASMARSAIERNRRGSIGRWYILKSDMMAKDRLAWTMRTGGLFDGLSALLTEFTSPDHWFYTKFGQGKNKEKKQAFKAELIRFYRGQYENERQTLRHAQEIEFGIRAKDKMGKYVLAPITPKDMIQGFSKLDIEGKIESLQRMPVSSKAKNNRKYYGYSLQADGVWLDPSILGFKSANELEKTLLSEVNKYEQTLI